MGPTSDGRDPLDAERIVVAAVALADEHGVDALSMRKVAARLGFGVMSLYNHVVNKDHLLALMVDFVAAEIGEPAPGLPPLEAVRRLAVSTREMFVAHPWVPPVWQRYTPGPARVRHMEQLLRLLAESDLSPELAHHGFDAVNNHVLGYTLQELGMGIGKDGLAAAAEEFLAEIDTGDAPHTVAHVRQHLAGQTASSFELVLDLILDGFRRLDAGHR